MKDIILFSASTIMSVLCYMMLLDICIGKNKINISENVSFCELFFGACVICTIENIFISFLLALIGCYSLDTLSILVILKNVGLLLNIYKKRVFLRRVNYKKEINIFIMLIIVISGILYFFFPTEYLWGRRDPIIYVIKGVNIVNTGSVFPEKSEYLNTYYGQIEAFTDLTYRGVYSDFLEGTSPFPGDIKFQFLDFFAALLAIGYSLAGLNGLFRIQTVIAVLCLLSLYYYTKHFFDKRVGNIATFFLAMCPAQIWSARITQTELLYQLFWLLGIYIFGIAWKYKSRKIMFLSGCVMGFIGLNRIDSYILGLGIFAILIYYNLFLPEKSELVVTMGIGYSLSSAISFIYSYIYSYYYVRDHWKVGVLSLLIIVNTVMAIVALITYVLKNKLGYKLRKYNLVVFICDKKMYRVIICWIVFWILRLIYYARPLRQKGENKDYDFSQRAFYEFCWYTTAIVVLFGVFGLYYLMKDQEKRKQVLCFITTGSCMMIIYIWKPSVAMDHLWASRRWISTCIPFIFILSAYGIIQVSCRYLKVVERSIILAVLILVSGVMLNKSKLFLLTPMLNEMEEQYESLVENMDDDKVYFAQMSHYASVLRFIYGKNVYVLKSDSKETINEYLENENRSIYYIGDIEIFSGQVKYEKLYEGNIEGTYINQTAGVYPSELTKTGAITNIYRIY